MKRTLLSFTLTLLVAVGLGVSSVKADEEVVIKIGASPAPHSEILEKAAEILEEEGIILDIVVINDYVTPNRLLYEEELDANFFQHIPYLDTENESHDYELVNLGGVHIEPMAVYSNDYESLEDLPDGAKIIVSNNPAEEGRFLSFFVNAGLVEVDEDVDIQDATFDDIRDNPHDFDFDNSSAAELLVSLHEYNEGDVVIINSNFALDGGLNPLEDSIAIEDGDSPYANIVAVRSGDEERPELLRLIEVLQSDEIQDFILENYDGAVVPAVSDEDDEEDADDEETDEDEEDTDDDESEEDEDDEA